MLPSTQPLFRIQTLVSWMSLYIVTINILCWQGRSLFLVSNKGNMDTLSTQKSRCVSQRRYSTRGLEFQLTCYETSFQPSQKMCLRIVALYECGVCKRTTSSSSLHRKRIMATGAVRGVVCSMQHIMKESDIGCHLLTL